MKFQVDNHTLRCFRNAFGNDDTRLETVSRHGGFLHIDSLEDLVEIALEIDEVLHLSAGDEWDPIPALTVAEDDGY